MYFYQYIFMCLYVFGFLYFQVNALPIPEWMRQANTWVSFAFLLIGIFFSGRVIVDCIITNAKGQMTSVNMMRGILLATLNFLPTLLMSIFMLREGFVQK